MSSPRLPQEDSYRTKAFHFSPEAKLLRQNCLKIRGDHGLLTQHHLSRKTTSVTKICNRFPVPLGEAKRPAALVAEILCDHSKYTTLGDELPEHPGHNKRMCLGNGTFHANWVSLHRFFLVGFSQHKPAKSRFHCGLKTREWTTGQRKHTKRPVRRILSSRTNFS